MTKIINDINRLSLRFRDRFDPRREEVKAKYPDAQVFESLRTQARQRKLFNESNEREKKWLPRITWTMKSNHLTWDAVDIVFYDDRRTQKYDNKPTWFWPYDDLIEMAKKYGIRNLKPKETCHFEYDPKFIPIKEIIMYYKKIFDEENPKGGTIITKVDEAVERCTNKDGSANVWELVYLLGIMAERLRRRDDVQAKALTTLSKKNAW